LSVSCHIYRFLSGGRIWYRGIRLIDSMLITEILWIYQNMVRVDKYR